MPETKKRKERRGDKSMERHERKPDGQQSPRRGHVLNIIYRGSKKTKGKGREKEKKKEKSGWCLHPCSSARREKSFCARGVWHASVWLVFQEDRDQRIKKLKNLSFIYQDRAAGFKRGGCNKLLAPDKVLCCEKNGAMRGGGKERVVSQGFFPSTGGSVVSVFVFGGPSKSEV